QFEPFDNFALDEEDVFQLENQKPFKGTLFRLPLRSDENSLISKKTHNANDMARLLRAYKYQALSELIFLRNVKSVEMYEKSNKNKLNHSSGIALLLDCKLPKTPNTNINLNGKIYSNLSLPKESGLPFNLNSCGWDLSSDKNNIQLTSIHDDDRAEWNNFILN